MAHKQKYNKQQSNKQKQGLRGGWSSTSNNPHERQELEQAYSLLSQAITEARTKAEKHYADRGLPMPYNAPLDLRAAGTILDQHPQLARYLETAREREWARQKASPTGYPSAAGTARSDSSSLGGWAGISTPGGNTNQPIGVHDARRLRQWVDNDEWVSSAVNFLATKVALSDIAVLPADERKPYNKAVLKGVELVLDQPNELRDTLPMLLGMFVRDLLTIGQGVLTKNMTMGGRKPVGLYCENAADMKTYPGWSGDPDEPRYVFCPGSGDWGLSGGMLPSVPLRNDEAIVAYWNPTSFRLGWSPIQILANTIEADLKATAAAIHMVDFKSPPHILDFKGASEQQIRNMRSTYDTDVQGLRELMFTGSPNGIQAIPLVFSAKDNQFLEWQLYLVKKICAVLQVTPQDIGFTENTNRATADSQQVISDSKGFIPILLLIERYLNREFLADFAPRLPGGRNNLDSLNLRIIFPEVSETARQLHAEKSAGMAVKGMPGLPSFTPNQLLAIRGEESVPGGNTFWGYSPTLGAFPFLSYDGDYGSYLPLGTQDAAGGPSSTDAGVGADGSSEDDLGQSENAPAGSVGNEAGNNPAAGMEGNAGAAGGDSGGNVTTPVASGGGSGTGGASGGATTSAIASGHLHQKRWPMTLAKALPRTYGNTGVMVAFFLDANTAQQLAQIVGSALPPGCQPELAGDLHCTLGFFGDSDGWDASRVAAVSSALALFAQGQQPLDGVIGGIGRFNAPEGQPTPLYASIDAPMLPAFREALLQTLASVGVVPDMTHGYQPHCTLAYLSPEEPMPLDEIPAFPLHFAGLSLVVGDARYTFPLTGQSLIQQSQSKQVQPSRPAQQAAPRPTTTWSDTRQPGKAWSPTRTVRTLVSVDLASDAEDITALSQWSVDDQGQYRLHPSTTTKAQRHTHEEEASRGQLAAAITRVFSDVVARGHQEAGKER